ncbi:antifreeze protein [Mycena epipterygia]|nr:antifreeze protein [Mycena epipterygia]
MFSSVLAISFLSALGSVIALGPAPVNLRTAGNYAILAETGVSIFPPCNITGNVGVSPAAATSLTGFSPLLIDSTGQFSTSSQVVGKLFAASYAPSTSAILTTAVRDMGTAFTDATGRVNPNFSNLASGEYFFLMHSRASLTRPPGAIGGLVLGPGLYKFTSAVTIGADVTIAGAATDTWIFQLAGGLSVAAGKKMVLAGGALTQNIVWVVAGTVTAGTDSHLEGVILGKTSITLETEATANSRLLAQTSVALQKATQVNN